MSEKQYFFGLPSYAYIIPLLFQISTTVFPILAKMAVPAQTKSLATAVRVLRDTQELTAKLVKYTFVNTTTFYILNICFLDICIDAFISMYVLNNVVDTADHMILKTPHFCQKTETNRVNFISNTSGLKQLCTLCKLKTYTRMRQGTYHNTNFMLLQRYTHHNCRTCKICLRNGI